MVYHCNTLNLCDGFFTGAKHFYGKIIFVHLLLSKYLVLNVVNGMRPVIYNSSNTSLHLISIAVYCRNYFVSSLCLEHFLSQFIVYVL